MGDLREGPPPEGGKAVRAGEKKKRPSPLAQCLDLPLMSIRIFNNFSLAFVEEVSGRLVVERN